VKLAATILSYVTFVVPPIMTSYEKLLMAQYAEHLHLFTPLCYITANAVAFGYEANMPTNSSKSHRDIARDKAMAQAQSQCFMKGGDFVLSLSCEFSGDAEVCVCSFVGCVAQRREVACPSIADDKEYDEIVDDIELALEREFEMDSVTSGSSVDFRGFDSVSQTSGSSVEMQMDAYTMFAAH